MHRNAFLSTCACVILWSASPSKIEATPVGPAIVASAKTGFLINSIRELLNDAIDKATNSGDYLVFKNATELKSVIDSWQRANGHLIDKTFSQLDASQQRFFADAQALATQVERDTSNQMENALQITELLNQTLADAKVFDGQFALMRYSPRVAHAAMTGDQTLIIRGINFDKSNPTLTLPNNTKATRILLTKQEARFILPMSTFDFRPAQKTFKTLTLSYDFKKKGWLNKFLNTKTSRVSTPITLMQLPRHFGAYEFSLKTSITETKTKDFSREFYWSGRDTSHTENQGPHDRDWKIKMPSVAQTSEWGEAGRGCHVISLNENGFSIETRVGVIRKFPNINAPGYQHCIFNWQEYIEIAGEEQQPPASGLITWTADQAIALPDNKKSYVLRIKQFGGREFVTDRATTEKFVRVIEGKNLLTIKPQIPSDMNGF